MIARDLRCGGRKSGEDCVIITIELEGGRDYGGAIGVRSEASIIEAKGSSGDR
jgi:hypothetical protein